MAKKTKSPEKKTELSRAARVILRHAYDQVIVRAARLASFATAALLPGHSEVEERQEQLAIDDLVTFAIYVRRIIETSKNQKELRQATVTAIHGTKMEPTFVIDVINKIIHHQFIEIQRRKSQFKVLNFEDDVSITEWMKNFRVGIAPLVIVKSDRGKFIGFRLSDFIDAVLDKIIDPLVEYCAECSFYLEKFDFD